MTKKRAIILFTVCCLSLGIYLIFSKIIFGFGFPLDDAWIHQTYARNLVVYHQWAFIPGQPTSGSTSPLWTVLLAGAYLFDVNPYIWTFILSGLCLFLCSFFAEIIVRQQLKEYTAKLPWVGLFIALEWHLVWATGSGMETILLTAVYLLIFLLLLGKKANWWWLGGAIGLSVWIRPEGITWLGPVILLIIMQKSNLKEKLLHFRQLLGSLIGFVASYLLFNYWLSGTIFPNTFYAKQIEYSIMLQTSFIQRFFSLLALPLIGTGAILLPGVIVYLIKAIKERNWSILLSAIWFLGYIVLYSIMLPVTYQYGRYLMPCMPVLFIFGLMGLIVIYRQAEDRMAFRILKKVWLLSVILISIGFYVIGGNAYANNVRLIESEMVTAAKWINENTEQGSIVAAHDIGALGYFGNREIIDLAGLISPDIIPIIRDEPSLAKKLDALHADYLMTFPSWYNALPNGKQIVFEAGVISDKNSSDHMTVYRWKSP